MDWKKMYEQLKTESGLEDIELRDDGLSIPTGYSEALELEADGLYSITVVWYRWAADHGVIDELWLATLNSEATAAHAPVLRALVKQAQEEVQ